MSESSSSTDPSSGSRYFKLGLFVILSVALFVAGLIVLGFGSVFEKKLVAETFVSESVNGLDVGSAVKFRGVTVGKVSKIQFADDKYDLYPNAPPTAATTRSEGPGDAPLSGAIVIQMAIELDKAFPNFSEDRAKREVQQMVHKGLRARVTMAGISGQSYVDLDLLDPKQYPIPDLGITPKELFIPSAPSAIGQVLNAAEQIASDLQKANVGQVVRHIDDLATNATATVADVRRTIDANRDKITRVMDELPAVAARLKAVSARAEQILDDPRVDRAITGLGGLGDSAPVAVADVRRLARRLDDLVAAEGEDIRSILADLKRVAANAAAITDDAHRNPARLLFGDPPPRTEPGK